MKTDYEDHYNEFIADRWTEWVEFCTQDTFEDFLKMVKDEQLLNEFISQDHTEALYDLRKQNAEMKRETAITRGEAEREER